MNLNKIALITTILGLFLLYFFSQGYSPLVTHLDGENEEVRVEGKITRLTSKDNVKFLEIDGCKQEKLNLIIFTDEDIYPKVGDYIEASGTIEEYQGKKELIIDELLVK